MTNKSKGPGTGASGGPYEAAGAAALAELVARLHTHSESLRRDIGRLQRALSEINSAMALSLDRVERLRSNTQRLQALFDRVGNEPPGADPGADIRERRTGADRRSGLDRRRDAGDVAGLMRWIEGTSLDRRSGGERRAKADRRAPHGKPRRLPPPAPGSAVAAAGRQADQVVSLAEYRLSRAGEAKPDPATR